MHDRGLYAHIRRNRAKPVILLAFFIVLHLALNLAFITLFLAGVLLTTLAPDETFSSLSGSGGDIPLYSGVQALPLVWSYLEKNPDTAILAIAGITLLTLLSFAYSLYGHWRAGQVLPGRPLSRAEAPELYNLVQNLAIQFGLPEPEIRVVASQRMNAFAHGLTRQNATIIITQGMIGNLTRQELEAVLAHEMTHIGNGDTQFMTVAQACFDLGVTAFLRKYSGNPQMAAKGLLAAATLVVSSWLIFPRDFNVLMIAIGLLELTPVALRSLIFKANEFAADAGALEVTKNPLALVSALRKIEGLRSLPVSRSIVAAMMISGPSKGTRATHPPLEERISAIVRHGGVQVDEYMRAAATTPAAPAFAQTARPVFGQAPARPVFGQASRPVLGQAQSAAKEPMASSPDGPAGSEEELNVWLEEVSKDRDLSLKLEKFFRGLDVVIVKSGRAVYAGIILLALLHGILSPVISALIK